MEEYLMHHGILGQKWGIRRFQNSDGSLTPAGKTRYAKTSEVFERPRPISEMSDDELRRASDRMQLEQRYKQLLQQSQPPKKEKFLGEHFVRDAVRDIASSTVKSIGKDVALYSARSMIREALQDDEKYNKIFKQNEKEKKDNK